MMDRRTFVAGAMALLAASLAAEAQQGGKIYRIGTLSGRSPGADSTRLISPVRDELRKLGYIEGRNVLFEDRFAEGHVDRFPQLADDLVRHNVDVIVAHGTAQALAASKASRSIPIVGVLLSAPVESGLVPSLARPGGNVTGLTLEASVEQAAKPLELIAALILRKQTVAVLFNSGYPGMSIFVDQIVAAGSKLNLGTDLVRIERPADIEPALRSLREDQHGALLIVMDPVLAPHAQRITAAASSRKLPAIYVGGGVQQLASGGALIAYGPDVFELLRRAAYFVDKILKGAKPADLPIEQPTKFELVINLKTAKSLGLTIPQTLLLRADEVIQ